GLSEYVTRIQLAYENLLSVDELEDLAAPGFDDVSGIPGFAFGHDVFTRLEDPSFEPTAAVQELFELSAKFFDALIALRGAWRRRSQCDAAQARRRLWPKLACTRYVQRRVDALPE